MAPQHDDEASRATLPPFGLRDMPDLDEVLTLVQHLRTQARAQGGGLGAKETAVVLRTLEQVARRMKLMREQVAHAMQQQADVRAHSALKTPFRPPAWWTVLSDDDAGGGEGEGGEP